MTYVLYYILIAVVMSVIVNYCKDAEDLGEAVFIGCIWPLSLSYYVLKFLVFLGTLCLEFVAIKFWIYWRKLQDLYPLQDIEDEEKT